MIFDLLFRFFLVFAGIAVASILYFLASTASGSFEREQAPDSDPEAPAAGRKRDQNRTGGEEVLRAVVRCFHVPPAIPVRFQTSGYSDCRTLARVFDGNTACARGCLGLASCARACPADAIVLDARTISVTAACTGCALCVSACPRKLIELVPVHSESKSPCARTRGEAAPYGSPITEAGCEFVAEGNSGSRKPKGMATVHDKARYR